MRKIERIRYKRMRNNFRIKFYAEEKIFKRRDREELQKINELYEYLCPKKEY
jgi:hypothetical protein